MSILNSAAATVASAGACVGKSTDGIATKILQE